jgi:hypothetical protein
MIVIWRSGWNHRYELGAGTGNGLEWDAGEESEIITTKFQDETQQRLADKITEDQETEYFVKLLQYQKLDPHHKS